MMGLLQDGLLDWLQATTGASNSLIEESKRTVVRTSHKEIGVLGGELHGTKWGSWLKNGLWYIGVSQVPNVGVLWHVGWLLLESELGIGGTDSVLAWLWMPCDLGHTTLHLLWILEDHHCLGRDWLRHVLWLFMLEVLLKEIDLVVLFDAALSSPDKVLGRPHIVQGRLLGQLTHVLVHFVGLLRIVLFGPSSNLMVTSSVISGNSLCVNLYHFQVSHHFENCAQLHI